jgi:hypothetical protein
MTHVIVTVGLTQLSSLIIPKLRFAMMGVIKQRRKRTETHCSNCKKASLRYP